MCPTEAPPPAGSPRAVSSRFQYSKKGLSVDRLRVLLHPVSDDESDGSMSADHRDDFVIWESTSVDDQGWMPIEKLITSSRDHTVRDTELHSTDIRRLDSPNAGTHIHPTPLLCPGGKSIPILCLSPVLSELVTAGKSRV